MKFASVSCAWRAKASDVKPEELLQWLIEEITGELPADALGHVKGHASFEDGDVFASATIIPKGVTIQKRGEYTRGELKISVVLNFSDIDKSELRRALGHAKDRVESRTGSTLIEDKE